MATMISKGQLVSLNSVFSPEELFNIQQKISAMTSVFTSHDRRLKDIAVISQDLSQAAAYDSDLETIEALLDFETLMDGMEASLDKGVYMNSRTGICQLTCSPQTSWETSFCDSKTSPSRKMLSFLFLNLLIFFSFKPPIILMVMIVLF